MNNFKTQPGISPVFSKSFGICLLHLCKHVTRTPLQSSAGMDLHCAVALAICRLLQPSSLPSAIELGGEISIQVSSNGVSPNSVSPNNVSDKELVFVQTFDVLQTSTKPGRHHAISSTSETALRLANAPDNTQTCLPHLVEFKSCL